MLALNSVDSCFKFSLRQEKEVFGPATNTMDLIGRSSIDVDDTLTSLQWLQEISVFSVSEEAPSSLLADDLGSIPLSPGMSTATTFPGLCTLPNLAAHGHCPDETDYKTNPHMKPPYSYVTLICMAMQASKEGKVRLSGIYKWITDNFCYFCNGDPSWQNSIRHNLSVNKCFKKVPRQKDEPGKGGYWKVDPEYAEHLLAQAYMKQSMAPVQINPALQNQLGVISQPDINVCKVSPESLQLLEEFEKVTELEQNLDLHLTEATSVDSRDAVKGKENRRKRKLEYDHEVGAAKAVRRCSSPLLVMEQPKIQETINSTFDWDALLHSILNEDWNPNEGGPLSPTPQDQDHIVHDMRVSPLEASASTAEDNVLIENLTELDPDFNEETLLDLLQSVWREDEEGNQANDLFTIDVNQLFDLGVSFSADTDREI